MESPRNRRVQRIHLAQPLPARLGSIQVSLVDVSVLGARVEHHQPVTSGTLSRLTFSWNGQPIAAGCRIVRSRLERFSSGADGLTVYHSGLEFETLSHEEKTCLRNLVFAFVTRALEEQKLNARGVLPQHDLEKMPIFRYGGELTANARDLAHAAGSSSLPLVRMTKEAGYLCYQLDRGLWRKKRTQDPGQPAEGFTVSALEDREQAEQLCEAYRQADAAGRELIRLLATIAIADREDVEPGRFNPH